jgi:hypothetical protein
VSDKIYARLVLLLLLIGACCTSALALHSTTHLVRHTRRHHHLGILWNPLFRPTHESMLRQNQEVDRLELPRIQDDDELDELKLSGALLPINESEALHFDPRLPAMRRYCRPWTRDFVEDISQAYYKEFHAQLQVHSAVRAVKDQKRLRRHNRNAAPESGETASSHLAGITVDLQRRGMTAPQIQWMEQYMVPLQSLGLVEPEEERHQWVFHIMVSDRYEGWRETNLLVATKSPEPLLLPIADQTTLPITSRTFNQAIDPPPVSLLAQVP